MAINKWGKNKKKNTYGNTFYREAMTGGLEKEPYTLRKLGKHTFKAGKWATFGFLAVTAIWGCVDGFRVKTNPVVSRGMELYMSHDDVLPNLYNTIPETGYRYEAAELNPVFFDEEYQDIADFPSTLPSYAYISEKAPFTAADIKNNKHYKAARAVDSDGGVSITTDEFDKFKESGNLYDSLVPRGIKSRLGSNYQSEIFTDNPDEARKGLRILPLEIYNPYLSEFVMVLHDKIDQTSNANTERDTLWNDMLHNGKEAPKPWKAGSEDFDYKGKPWNATTPFDEVYTNDHFNQEDIFINMAEFSDPMGWLDASLNVKGSQYKKLLETKFGIEDSDTVETYTKKFREFREQRWIPTYFKQISSTDNTSLSTLVTLDYMGGNDIFVDEFDNSNKTSSVTDTQANTSNISKLSHISGAPVVNDTKYDNEIADQNPDSYKHTFKYANTAFVKEGTYNDGIGFASATSNEYIGRLNLAKWTKEEVAEEKLPEELIGEFKYRQDALEYVTNYFSFLNGQSFKTQDVVKIIADQNDNKTEQDIIDWVNGGLVTTQTGSIYSSGEVADLAKGNTYDDSYEVDIFSSLEAGFTDNVTDLSAVPNNNNYAGYYNGAELKFGTSFMTIGHQQKKGFQVVPTTETIEYSKEIRGDDWYQGTKYTDYKGVRDKQALDAGWTFMNQDGEIQKFYYDIDGNGINLDTIEKIDNMSISEYQRLLDNKYSNPDIRAGLTAKSLTQGMGSHEFASNSISHLDTIDGMVEYYSGKKAGMAPPNFQTYNKYSEFALTEEFNVELYSISNFTGLSELSETSLNPYRKNWNTEYFTNNTTDFANASIVAAGNSSFNGDHYALVEWGEAWAISPFYGTFVWPLSKVAIFVQGWFPASWGIWGIISGIFIIVMGLRFVSTIFSFGAHKKQTKMQEIQFQVSKINAKYAAHEGNKAMKRRKQMEIMALYRKNNINPMGSMSSIFTTMPVFLAIWTIINSLYIYKTATVGAVSFAASPLTGVFSFATTGGVFIPIAAAIISVQIISAKLPQWLSQKRQGIRHLDEQTREAMKKQNKTTTVMVVVFVIMGMTVPTLLGMYWMYSGLFTIGQNLIQHYVAQKRARMQGIEKEEHKWIVKAKREFEAIKNAEVWDTVIWQTK